MLFSDDELYFFNLITIYFFIVDCQTDLQITPINGEVQGSLGERVTLQWNILKGNDTDRILLLDVCAVYGTASELLFQIDPLTKQPSIVQRANDIFGERISAVFIDHKMYQLTLENLKYNDSILFTLRVATINRIYISKISVGKIQLNVKGMEHFMICFLVSKKVNKM